MLQALFLWLDHHPITYWIGAGMTTAALLAAVAARFRAEARGTPRRHDVWFGLLLLGFLLAWRWPYLFAANEYNPDESQLIAGAMTLWHDPVPWRSLDVATSGPLNYYVLVALHALGLPFDYFSARLAGLLLLAGALVACLRLFRSHGTPATAALAVLPGAAFLATASDSDFVHYSSEHGPLFLTALAGCCLLRRAPATRDDFLGGLVAGLLPWAKLQAAPFVLVLAGLRVAGLLTAGLPPAEIRRRLALLAAGLVLPSVLALAGLAATGQVESFAQSYLFANLDYVKDAPTAGSLGAQFLAEARARGHVIVCGAVAAGLLLLGGAAALAARRRPGPLWFAGAAATACAAFCILTPQRPLLHYLLFGVVPLAWWTGATVLETLAARHRPGFFAGAFALLALGPLAWQCTQEDPNDLGRLASDWRHPRSAAGNLLRTYRQPEDTLAVWGWWPALYVDAQMRQATHDGNTAWSMPLAAASRRDFYQARYLRDLAANPPAFFVDATGPGAPFFADRTRAAHENVPVLAAFIARDYRLWIDLGPARIFVRRDSTLPTAPAPARLAEAAARARRGPGLAASRPDAISPANATTRTVRGRPAQMLLPGTAVTWRLDGTERAVWLDYGFHPDAVAAAGSNGVDIWVEIVTRDAAPRLLFQRRIDPRRAGDRGPLATRLVLPAFGPDSRLIVRTTAGDNGDEAWDWAYLQRLRFLRSAHYRTEQFPGFNRAPDSVTGGSPGLIDATDGRRLALTPPAELSFRLTGGEHTLRFAYGFETGAYTGDGHTDGARFVIESRRAGRTTEIFGRTLQPAAVPMDRGRQQADVALTGIAAGDELVVRVEPGPSDSWDWTYLSDLQLR